MDAREHRAEAERLLEVAKELQPGVQNSGHLAALQITVAMANAHSAIYLGDQFATEFDPATGLDRLMDDLRSGDHDTAVVPLLDIPPRFDRRRDGRS